MKDLMQNRNNKEGRLYYTRKEKKLLKWSNNFFIFCVVICLCVTMFNIYLSPADVVGRSMQPTYNSQYVDINSPTDTAYYSQFVKPKRGDVVVVTLSESEQGKVYGIKRLIALGGDVVEFINNQLYINGEIVEEEYIQDISINSTTMANICASVSSAYKNWNMYNYNEQNFNHGYVKFEIPKGYFFYLGDNRSVSADCSVDGPQPMEKLLAKILFVVPYNQNLITYFWSEFCKLFY